MVAFARSFRLMPPRRRGRRLRGRRRRAWRAARTSGAHLGRQAGSAITFAEITDRSAQQLVQRQAERLALDVPQRHIQRALRMRLFAARRIEPRDVHLLPDGLDAEGILADERAGALFERVPRAAFADACDPGIGLHRHHHVALVEQAVWIGRVVDIDLGDLRFW